MKTLMMLIAGLLLAACSREAAAPPIAAEEFPVRAVVLGIDAPTYTITVKHNEIKGFSKAMTTRYIVKDKEHFGLIRAGSWINGSVSKDGDQYFIDHIVPEQAEK